MEKIVSDDITYFYAKDSRSLRSQFRWLNQFHTWKDNSTKEWLAGQNHFLLCQDIDEGIAGINCSIIDMNVQSRNTMITPYRTPAAIEKYEPKKYGLIKKTGDNPLKVYLGFIWAVICFVVKYKQPHRCNYPGKFSHFLNWIKGIPFAEGSLFRCSCGETLQLRWDGWTPGYSHLWLIAGGEE